MKDDLSKLMKQVYNQPETGLSADIWRAIEVKQTKSLKIKSLSYGILGILSLGGFVLMTFSVVKQFASSGFFEYASLVFSDGSLLATYWREYLLSLADSLPVASLGAAFFLLFSMLISIKKGIKQYKSQLLVS